MPWAHLNNSLVTTRVRLLSFGYYPLQEGIQSYGNAMAVKLDNQAYIVDCYVSSHLISLVHNMGTILSATRSYLT